MTRTGNWQHIGGILLAGWRWSPAYSRHALGDNSPAVLLPAAAAAAAAASGVSIASLRVSIENLYSSSKHGRQNNNKQYKRNQTIIAQTKILVAHFKLSYAIGPQYD